MDGKTIVDITLKSLDAARLVGGEVCFKADVSGWDAGDVKAWVDTTLKEAPKHGLRFRGIRTDTAGFRKLGINQDFVNGGSYNGIPVVVTEVAFDTVEFVFQPVR